MSTPLAWEKTTSPIYLYLGRNYYADSLAQVAGIATFVNLADSENEAYSNKGYETTYYSTQNVIFLGIPPEFFSTSFKEGLVKGFRYMIEHEGPYLLHCTYGMDRTGFMIAVLEALMGATLHLWHGPHRFYDCRLGSLNGRYHRRNPR